MLRIPRLAATDAEAPVGFVACVLPRVTPHLPADVARTLCIASVAGGGVRVAVEQKVRGRRPMSAARRGGALVVVRGAAAVVEARGVSELRWIDGEAEKVPRGCVRAR